MDLLLSFLRVSLEQLLFCGYLNLTSDDSVTHVLSFLTGGNVNIGNSLDFAFQCFFLKTHGVISYSLVDHY